jgi:hypothetical protein
LLFRRISALSCPRSITFAIENGFVSEPEDLARPFEFGDGVDDFCAMFEEIEAPCCIGPDARDLQLP